MHLTAPDDGLICTSAIVATTIPVAIGAAFANKHRKNGRLVAVFFGDGAIDEGAFWESLNSACAMNLPVLFVCEDNEYAVHSPVSERHGYDSIADIASRFHCDVFREESTDAEVIHDLAKQAAESVHAKGRPAFLYLKYYRYLEHVGVNEDFNQGYRPKDESEPWTRVDPVNVMRAKLLQWIPENGIGEVESLIDQEIADNIRKAMAAPFPSPAELYKDVLA